MPEPRENPLCAFQHCVRTPERLALCDRHLSQIPEFHRRRLFRARRFGVTSRAYGRAVREAVAYLEERHIREMARSR